MKTRFSILLSLLAAFLLTPGTQAAESLSVLLQKGIFAEETEGNLDEAIQIYGNIVREGEANRSVVAQAQYRLGVCHSKRGSNADAIRILEQFVLQFPSETLLIQNARHLSTELGQKPNDTVSIRKLPLPKGGAHSVSDDGQFLSFMPRANDDVVVHETATGRSWIAITGDEGQSAWNGVLFSPDNRRIAYELNGSIYVAKADGSESRQVYHADPANQKPVAWVAEWSADGAHLFLVFRMSNSRTIAALDVTTGSVREIKRLENVWRFGNLRRSWDGPRLACQWGAGGENQRVVATLDLESGRETRLIEGEVEDLIGWSHDSARVLFTSRRTGVNGIWEIRVHDGMPVGTAELVKANVGDVSILDITRDGLVFYTEEKSSWGLHLAEVDFRTGKVLRQPQPVTDHFQGMTTNPVWSKDGQRLLMKIEGEQRQFLICSMAGGEVQRYPVSRLFTTVIQDYSWSPEGLFLLVQSVKSGAHGIHKYDLASGEAATIVTQEPDYWKCKPQLTMDGRSFYYTKRKFFRDNTGEVQSSKDQIILRDLNSGSERVVYGRSDKLQIWRPFETSPDGKRFALVMSDEVESDNSVVAIKIMELEGGETRELARFAPRENVTSLAWTPDGEHIACTLQRRTEEEGGSGKRELWVVAVDSGRSYRIQFPQERIVHFAIHPDGRQIVIQSGSWEGREVWVMEGLMTNPLASSR